jgi:hypothetical protein
VRSRSEEIRQSNCNAYINCSADLYVSSLLAHLTNTYTSIYSCILFIFASGEYLRIMYLDDSEGFYAVQSRAGGGGGAMGKDGAGTGLQNGGGRDAKTNGWEGGEGRGIWERE